MANPIIKIKRGSYLQNSQVVLSDGEPCYDDAKHRLYIGGGVNPISNRPYFGNSTELVDWTVGYKLTVPSTGTSTNAVNTEYTIDWDVLDEYFNYVIPGIVIRVPHNSNSSISTVPYFTVFVEAVGDVSEITGDNSGMIPICQFPSYSKSGQTLSMSCVIPRSNKLTGTIIIRHRANGAYYAWLHPIVIPEFPESAGGDIILPDEEEDDITLP